MSKADIVRYYQSSQWLYRLFCYNKDTLGIHFGFWEKDTKSRQEAMVNQDKEIIKVGVIKKGDRVLDAGCGVGGTAIYIAKIIGARVTGISLDPKQVRAACEHAKEKEVGERVDFLVGDYTKMDFANDTFDVVYGNESICYASPKASFLKEALRVLKPGGRLVVADGYCAYAPKTKEEKEIVEAFKESFALEEMITGQRMSEEMKKAGFDKVMAISKTTQVVPSIVEWGKMADKATIVANIARWMPIDEMQAIYRNMMAMKMAVKAHRIGLAAYWIHRGIKPRAAKLRK